MEEFKKQITDLCQKFWNEQRNIPLTSFAWLMFHSLLMQQVDNLSKQPEAKNEKQTP